MESIKRIVLASMLLKGICKPNFISVDVRRNNKRLLKKDIETLEIISRDKTNRVSKIKVNNNVLEVNLEDNEATRSLVEKLKNGDISVNANEYGEFEKVGNLGFSLPRKDESITTSAGDIVLYQGNQISLFYNSNSWSYTKLGRATNVNGDELKDILGSGDVTLILSLD